MIADESQVWQDLLALFISFGAAAIEAADVRRGIDGTPGFGSAQPRRFGSVLPRRFGFDQGGRGKAGNGGDEGLGVGVSGVVENGVGGAGFDEFAEVHDEDAIAQ